MEKNIKVLKNGNLFDGTGSPILENTVVVVKDDKITAVGKLGQVEIPIGDNVEEIDITGKTIMPGLIESHIHINLDGTYGKHAASMAMEMNKCELMMRSIPRLLRTFKMGYTTIRDGGSGWGWIEVALRDGFERGDIFGPRYSATGYHLTVYGGHAAFMPYHLGKYQPEETGGMYCDGPEEWRKAARLNIWNRVDNLKLVASRGFIGSWERMKPTFAPATVAELRAATEAGHAVNIPVICHADGTQAVMNAIEAGVDIIVHGYWMDEKCADLMAKKGVYWEVTTATIRNEYLASVGELPDMYKCDQPFDQREWNPEISCLATDAWDHLLKHYKRSVDNSGVKVLMGSDAGCALTPHGLNAAEIETQVQLGLDPKVAFKVRHSDNGGVYAP